MTLDKLFIMLLLVHQLGDTVFQTDLVSRAKRGQVEGIPQSAGLAFHAFTHAALVLLVTDSMVLFIMELLCHWAIDWAKISGSYGNKVDQVLHVSCKVVWVLYMLWIRSVFP